MKATVVNVYRDAERRDLVRTFQFHPHDSADPEGGSGMVRNVLIQLAKEQLVRDQDATPQEADGYVYEVEETPDS